MITVFFFFFFFFKQTDFPNQPSGINKQKSIIVHSWLLFKERESWKIIKSESNNYFWCFGICFYKNV